LGAQYRHKTITDVTDDKGTAIFPAVDLKTKFTLPSRVGMGGRYDISDFGVAVDAEYALNSQNKGAALTGTVKGTGGSPDMPAEVPNQFRWTNAWTVRTGFEYRLYDNHVPVRVGYIWDQKTSNPQYPSAFGTPPGASHVGTLGSGWNAGAWQVNAAYAYRTAKGTVKQSDLDAATESCILCGGAGDYELTMHGMYVDFSYDWK
jgi:hypothetical protein